MNTLSYGYETRVLSKMPSTLQELKQMALEFFQVVSNSFQYYDDEHDLITITSEVEFTEALQTGTKLALIVPMNSASVINAMEMIHSESEKSESSMILVSPDEDYSILEVSEKADQRSFRDYEMSVQMLQNPLNEGKREEVPMEEIPIRDTNRTALDQFEGNVEEEQKLNQNPIEVQPSSSTSEKSVKTEHFGTNNASTGVSKAETGSDSIPLVHKESFTKQVHYSSSSSNTYLVPTEHQSFNTQTQQSVSIGPSKVDFAQQRNVGFDPDFFTSLKSVIRDELLSASRLKLSGIIVSHKTKCGLCQAYPIVGIRYKCSECELDLCETCENEADHPHPMYKKKMIQEEVKEEAKVAKIRKLVIDNRGAEYARPNSKELVSRVQQIKEAGYTDDMKILEALDKANFDVAKAFEYLFDNEVNLR